MFTWALSEIDNVIRELQTNPQQKYVFHVGGGFYVAVTAGVCASIW